MQVVRYKSTNGTRVAIIGQEGRKYLPTVILDSSGIRITKLQKGEARYMSQLEGYPARKACRRFLRYGREVGITKTAKQLLKGGAK